MLTKITYVINLDIYFLFRRPAENTLLLFSRKINIQYNSTHYYVLGKVLRRSPCKPYSNLEMINYEKMNRGT